MTFAVEAHPPPPSLPRGRGDEWRSVCKSQRMRIIGFRRTTVISFQFSRKRARAGETVDLRARQGTGRTELFLFPKLFFSRFPSPPRSPSNVVRSVRDRVKPPRDIVRYT